MFKLHNMLLFLQAKNSFSKNLILQLCDAVEAVKFDTNALDAIRIECKYCKEMVHKSKLSFHQKSCALYGKFLKKSSVHTSICLKNFLA